jgi:hypothetical protein
MKKVKLTKPGIKAVGEYQAGEVYEVDDKLADILISVKGFERADTDPVSAPAPAKTPTGA